MSNTCLYSPAAERHRTLAGTQLPSRWGRRLSWPGWLGETLSWFGLPARRRLPKQVLAVTAGNGTRDSAVASSTPYAPDYWLSSHLNTAHNSSDNRPSYPPDSHHCADAVNLWEGRHHPLCAVLLFPVRRRTHVNIHRITWHFFRDLTLAVGH